MRKFWIALAVVAGLTAGCGGGGSSEDAEASATPEPAKVYTLEQLEAALPTVDDVPDALEEDIRCPGDDDFCGGDPSPSVSIKLTPADAASAERADQAGVAADFVFVSAKVSPTEAEAQDALAEARRLVGRYDGDYDISRQELENGGYVSGETGTGRLSEVDDGVFAGFRMDRTVTREEGPAQQVGLIEVVSGTALIVVQVELISEGRGADAATQLAQQLLDDYLRRLG